MKQEFEMLQEEMDEILRINHAVKEMPVMMVGGAHFGGEKQSAINKYWEILGDKYGFKWDSVEGSAKGKLFFLATPKPIVIPKTKTEIEMDKYDTLQKIVDQLEFCNYQTADTNHDLKDNIAFLALKRMAQK